MLLASFWQYLFQMPQIAVVMGCLIPIAGIVCGYWYKTNRVRLDNSLKRSMLERGMSADEIERVISAGTRDDDA